MQIRSYKRDTVSHDITTFVICVNVQMLENGSACTNTNQSQLSYDQLPTVDAREAPTIG